MKKWILAALPALVFIFNPTASWAGSHDYHHGYQQGYHAAARDHHDGNYRNRGRFNNSRGYRASARQRYDRWNNSRYVANGWQRNRFRDADRYTNRFRDNRRNRYNNRRYRCR